MNTLTEAQNMLAASGYRTRHTVVDGMPVVAFEDETLVGFLYDFPTASDLLERWRACEECVLSRFAGALRQAGDKAWNVYTVLLTEGSAGYELERRMRAIEEDLHLTRKIARCEVVSVDSLRPALLPLLPIDALFADDVRGFGHRLTAKLQNVVPDTVAAALIGPASAEAVARTMIEGL